MRENVIGSRHCSIVVLVLMCYTGSTNATLATLIWINDSLSRCVHTPKAYQFLYQYFLPSHSRVFLPMRANFSISYNLHQFQFLVYEKRPAIFSRQLAGIINIRNFFRCSYRISCERKIVDTDFWTKMQWDWYLTDWAEGWWTLPPAIVIFFSIYLYIISKSRVMAAFR